MAASEVEVNSSISMLEKGYSLVNKVGSTVYAFTYATGYLGNSSQNPNATMQWALDNSPGVLIKAAAYGNVVLTVNSGNHLIIEKNATAIYASAAPGASCMVEDHNLGLTRHYQNGVLADPVTVPSFTIDVQGGVYRAVNSTQRLVSQGTNHSSVFQDAVGNLTSGGSIFWKAGRYPMTANHMLPSGKSNITFSGEGARSILYLNANYTNMFNVTGANYLTFENLAFDGNKAACSLSRSGHIDLCAIMLFSGKGNVVTNCKFYNWVNHPIVESLGGTSGYNTVTLCEFYNNTFWDIAFAGSGGHSIASNNICNSSYGFEVGGTSTGYQCWTGNVVTNPAGKGFIINGPHNTVSNNIIHGGAGYGYGFEIDSPNNTIMNNVVDGCQNYALLVYMTSDNVIFGNVVTGTV
jgi:parallel beta-helix repeat protein